MSFDVLSGVSQYFNTQASDDAKDRDSQSQAELAVEAGEAPFLNSAGEHREAVDDSQRLEEGDGKDSLNVRKDDKKRRKSRRGKKRKRYRFPSDTMGVKRIKKAPYNTTQFIMNDHCERIIDIEEIRKEIERSHRKNDIENRDGEEFYSSPEDESEYLQQQFTIAYDNIYAERLNSKPKSELVQEYLELEDRVESLEKRLKESRTATLQRTLSDSQMQTELLQSDCESDEQSENSSHDHLVKLAQENEHLRKENERLQKIISECALPSDQQALHLDQDKTKGQDPELAEEILNEKQ